MDRNKSIIRGETIKFRYSNSLFSLFILFGFINLLFSFLYVNSFWGYILCFIFIYLCFTLIFRKNVVFNFKINIKLLLIIFILLFSIIDIYLINPLKNDILFVPWHEIIFQPLFLRLILTLVFPFILGYVCIEFATSEKTFRYDIISESYFLGVFILTFLYLVSDLLGIHKAIGITLLSTIIFLVTIFKEIFLKNAKKIKDKHFHLSVYDLALFIFAVISYLSVHLNENSILKGDFWKQIALASTMQLSRFRIYKLYKTTYPWVSIYFMASTSKLFSLPLINFAVFSAAVFSAISVLSMLSFFSSIKVKNVHNGARWATLAWFMFSGFGLLYLILKYNVLVPSCNQALTIMQKLGWGSGLVFSSSMNHFSHIIRLFSLAGVFMFFSISIRKDIMLRKKILGIPILIASIIFHPLISTLCFIIIWLAFTIFRIYNSLYLEAAFISSSGIAVIVYNLFIPMPYIYNYLLFIIGSVCILTVVRKLFKYLLSRKSNIMIQICFSMKKIILLIILIGYFYSLSFLYWNYDKLYLERFPTIPIYAWANIMGINGFLTLTYLGFIIFSNKLLNFDEKFSITFLIFTFICSIALDYNNINQLIRIFNPNIISFRLIPILSIPISYLAGIQLEKLNKNIYLNKSYAKKISLLFLYIILFFTYISFLSRIRFWMNVNYPSYNFNEYQISDEELRLIQYLRYHLTGNEIVVVKDTIRGIWRYGEASPLGRIVSLSGANVISKELGYMLFQAQSIETIELLQKTLNLRYIIVRKSWDGFKKDMNNMLLVSLNPIYETNKYAVYNISFPLENSKFNSTPDINNPIHYGIFSKDIRLKGNIKLKADSLYIKEAYINNVRLTDIIISGNVTLSMSNIEGILTSFNSKLKILLNKKENIHLDTFSKIISNGIIINIDKQSIFSSSSIILPEEAEVEVNGSIFIENAILTWPYINKIGCSRSLNFTGIIVFSMLNVKDKYIPIMLKSFSKVKCYAQDEKREMLIKYNSYHYYNMNWFPVLSVLSINDLLAFLFFLLILPLSFILTICITTGIRIIIKITLK